MITHDCFKKCCPAVHSYSYEFEKIIIPKDDYLHNNCEMVTLFYLKGQFIKMTVFKEIPLMSVVDLFGLVGGYLGLFVGISLVTICEFVEFIIEWSCSRQK